MSDFFQGRVTATATRRLKLEESWLRVIPQRHRTLFELSQELLDAVSERPNYSNPDMNAFEVLCLELEHVFADVSVEETRDRLATFGYEIDRVSTPLEFPDLSLYPETFWLYEWMARKFRYTYRIEAITLITLELVGAHVPEDDLTQRGLLIRALCEMHAQGMEGSPIATHIREAHGPEVLEDLEALGRLPDVAGILLESRRTSVVTSDDGVEGAWWATDGASESLQVQAYELLVHPDWLGEWTEFFQCSPGGEARGSCLDSGG